MLIDSDHLADDIPLHAKNVQDNYARSRGPAPLGADLSSRLPVEILGHIMLLVKSLQVWSMPIIRYHEPTLQGVGHWLRPKLTLSHVCRHWRDVAVGLPALWDDLYYSHDVQPEAFLLALRRTKDAPLSWNKILPLSEGERVLAALTANMHRVSSLNVTIGFLYTEQLAELQDLLASWRFPMLRQLKILSRAGRVLAFHIDCPRVQHVELTECHPRFWAHTCTALASLRLRDLDAIVTQDLVEVLRSTQQLHVLELHNVYISAGFNIDDALAHAPRKLIFRREYYGSAEDWRINRIVTPAMACTIDDIELRGLSLQHNIDFLIYSGLHLSMLAEIREVQLGRDHVVVIDATGRRRSFAPIPMDAEQLWSMLTTKLRVHETAVSWTLTPLIVPFLRLVWHYAPHSTFAATRIVIGLAPDVLQLSGANIWEDIPPFPQLRVVEFAPEAANDSQEEDGYNTPAALSDVEIVSSDVLLGLLPPDLVTLEAVQITRLHLAHNANVDLEHALGASGTAVRFTQCTFREGTS